jgi:RNA polymerase sigma-70 factor (ECF subfamily)
MIHSIAWGEASLAGGRPMTSQVLAIRVPQAAVAQAPAAGQATASAASDEALIARIAAGDRLAMRVLFARHHVRVYRFVLRLVRDEALAEDLISEVFFDVWRQAASFEARSTASTWLLAIARFKALSSLRRRGEEPLDETMATAIEDGADDPEVALRRRQQHALLHKCWSKLSPEHRHVIDLVYFQEKAIGEVATILGIPENTVKTRMFYARKRLAELLRAAGMDRDF